MRQLQSANMLLKILVGKRVIEQWCSKGLGKHHSCTWSSSLELVNFAKNPRHCRSPIVVPEVVIKFLCLKAAVSSLSTSASQRTVYWKHYGLLLPLHYHIHDAH